MTTFTTPKGTPLPILSLKGKDYLQVAHRLVWFREERPSWRIETEFVQLTEKHAIGRAIIKDESGNTIATAHKREDASHFPDFMEKAETGAIGRALAYVGYGTQWCADEIAEGHRIVDAPQERAPARVAPAQPAPYDGAPAQASGVYYFKTGKHKNRTAEEVGLDTLTGWVNWWTGKIQQGETVSGGLAQDLDHARQWLDYQAGLHPTQQTDDGEDVPF
jgi:hypothetical protein